MALQVTQDMDRVRQAEAGVCKTIQMAAESMTRSTHVAKTGRERHMEEQFPVVVALDGLAKRAPYPSLLTQLLARIPSQQRLVQGASDAMETWGQNTRRSQHFQTAGLDATFDRITDRCAPNTPPPPTGVIVREIAQLGWE